jgi:hypothetical protein
MTAKLQHAFRVLLRSLETVSLGQDEDTPRDVLYSAAAAFPPAPSPPSFPTALTNGDRASHSFHALKDRFSESPDLTDTASATIVTSFVSAHIDGRTQVCSLRPPPLHFHMVMQCYRNTNGFPCKAYAPLNVHVDDRSEVHDALDTFLLRVANDVLER